MSFFPLHQWRRATLLFSGLFLATVVIQLAVGWYERRAAARATLFEGIDEITRELKYSDRWDLTHFRQADLRVSRYFIVAANGLLIDLEGFVPDLVFQADLTGFEPGFQTSSVAATSETWRLLVVLVRGGRIVLGYRSPGEITQVDDRLRENAKYFDDSLEAALGANISDTDRYLEYVVLDDSGRVRFALGGVPLKLREYPRLPTQVINEIRTNQNITYGLLAAPVRDGSGRIVGLATVLNELPPQPWLSLRAWLTNLSASLALAFAGTLLGLRYIRDEFRPDDLLRDALDHGESSTIEFKEALRWDHWQQDQNKPTDPSKVGERRGIAEGIAVARVAGFLNTRAGGTLILGIADDKAVVGLERDYESLVKPKENRGGQDKDRDRFQLHLRNLIAAKIGRDISNLCVETAIVSHSGRDVCVIHAAPSPSPVYITDAKGKGFYLRVGASTVALDVEEAVAYCQERWPRPLWRRAGHFKQRGGGRFL